MEAVKTLEGRVQLEYGCGCVSMITIGSTLAFITGLPKPFKLFVTSISEHLDNIAPRMYAFVTCTKYRGLSKL